MEHMKELLTAFEEILDRKLEEKLEPFDKRLSSLETNLQYVNYAVKDEFGSRLLSIAEQQESIRRELCDA